MLLLLESFFVLWFSRSASSRVSQRHGITINSYAGLKRAWADIHPADMLPVFMTGISKNQRLILGLGILLPTIFFYCLILSAPKIENGIYRLFFLSMIGLIINATDGLFAKNNTARFVEIEGQSLEYVSLLAILIGISPAVFLEPATKSELAGILHFKLFQSPGYFLLGMGSLGSIVSYLRIGPAKRTWSSFGERSLEQYLSFRWALWLVCWISLWIIVFLGEGPLGVIGSIFFLLKLALMLVLLILLQASLSASRVTDVASFTIKYLVPISVMGLTIELVRTGMMF